MADELSSEQLAEIMEKDTLKLPTLHVCGKAYPMLSAYNYGVPDGDVDYRVACHGCHVLTFPCQTPQEAYATWQKHLTLTGASEVERLRAVNAAQREIVAWAAQQQPRVDEEMYEEACCPGCGASFGVLGVFDWDEKVAALEHKPDCPITKARALLALEEGGNGD